MLVAAFTECIRAQTGDCDANIRGQYRRESSAGTEGKPLWDGNAEIQVLRASVAHDAEWQQSRDQAIRDGEIDLNAGHDPDDWEVYFLEVRGTTKGQLGGGTRK